MTEITNKTSLCRNLAAMNKRCEQENPMTPATYILPEEYHDFCAHFLELQRHEPERNVWIVKPATSGNGEGIMIIDSVEELPFAQLSKNVESSHIV